MGATWEWIAAVAVLAGTLMALPFLLPAWRRSARAGVGGVMLGIGVAFSNLLDPAKRAATEELDKRKEIAGADEAERATAPPR